MIAYRFMEGYGLVAAVVGAGAPRFIYLAGEPPDSVRDACEGKQDQLLALIGLEGVEPVAGIASRVKDRANTALRWSLKKCCDLPFKRSQLPVHAAQPSTNGEDE